MKKKTYKIIAFLLALIVFAQCPAAPVSAAKAKLSKKRLTLRVGKTQKISIRNKKKGAKYTYQVSSKKVVTVSKKGVITARKKGTAKITVKEKDQKKTRKLGVISVTVKETPKSDKVQNTSTPAASATAPASAPTQSPSNQPAATGTPAATQTPTPTSAPTGTPEPTLELKPIVSEMPEGFDKKQDGVAYGTVQRQQYYSTTTEKDRKVNIILPAGYTEEKKYPVLYLLHGIGGDQNEWLNGGNPDAIVGNLTAEGLAKEMIIVIPNCRARANDSATTDFDLDHYAAFDNFINDLRDNLMPYMAEHYSIATGRENTAIAGLSMGGRESLNIGLNMTDTFGYIAAFSPGYGVFAYTANGVSEPGLFTEETFRLPDEYKNNTLLMINNGISEGGENAIGGTCHKVLEKNEIPHIFYVTEGGHDFQVWKHGLYNFALQIFQ